MAHVKGTLYVGYEEVKSFDGSAKGSESAQLADVIAQLKEVRELSNAAMSKLMSQYPDEGKDIDMEEEGEGEDEEEELQDKKESKKKRKLDKRKKSHDENATPLYIPEDILAKIFCYLPLATLIKISLVCGIWRRASKFEYLWQEQRRVFQGLLDPPGKTTVLHKELFISEYGASIQVFVHPKIERLGCYLQGMPDTEVWLKLQFNPNVPLHAVKQQLYSVLNTPEANRYSTRLEATGIVGCLNGLFNTSQCTPLAAVLMHAASLVKNRTEPAMDCAMRTLKNLDHHGITTTRQILSFSEKDLVEREVEPRLAEQVLRVIGKKSTWANLAQNGNWGAQTLRQCGVKSGCALRLIMITESFCGHYYDILNLPNPEKLHSPLKVPRVED